MMTPDRLRFVVFQEGDLWVAQCLEVDLSTSAARRDDLPRYVRRQVAGQLASDRKAGLTPFEKFRPAPQRFWQLYEMSEPWPDAPRPTMVQRLLSLWQAPWVPSTDFALAH